MSEEGKESEGYETVDHLAASYSMDLPLIEPDLDFDGNDDSIEWQGPEDERTKIQRNHLYGQTFEGRFNFEVPDEGKPDWFRKAFLQSMEGETDVDPDDLPGLPVESETCPVCDEDFYEDEEDWVEQNGTKYCSVDCLNEVVHG